MILAILHADRGVRVDKSAGAHLDLGSQDPWTDRPLLVSDQAGPTGQVLYAWLSAGKLILAAGATPLLEVSASSLGSDWLAAVRRLGRFEVVMNASGVDPLEVCVNPDAISGGANRAIVRLHPPAQVLPVDAFNTMATEFKVLAKDPRTRVKLPQSLPTVLTLRSLHEAGLLPPSALAAPVSVYTDAQGVGHSTRQCDKYTEYPDNDFHASVDMPAGAAVTSACVICGVHADRLLSTFDRYDPVARKCEPAAYAVSALGYEATRLLSSFESRGPWWAANEAYLAALRAKDEYHYDQEADTAALMASVLEKLLRSVESVTATARTSASTVLVDRALVVAGQEKTRGSIVGKLDSAVAGLGELVLRDLDSGVDVVGSTTYYAQMLGCPQEQVSYAVSPVLAWLDEQSSMVSTGPLTWILALGWVAPSVSAARLCAFRSGWVFTGVSDLNASMFAVPASAARVLVSIGGNQVLDAGLVGPDEDYEFATAAMRNMGTNSYVTSHRVEEVFSQTRTQLGLPDPNKALKWRSFSDDPVSMHAGEAW